MMDTSAVTIAGPEGPLEAIVSRPESTPVQSVAVLCHPHPLYGGSLHDQVLDVLARCLAERDTASVRFNFRGVGASAGSYSGSGGEIEDLRAVLEWVRLEYPAAELLLGGYSFGASVASQVMAEARPARVLLIAPPLGNMDVATPSAGTTVDVIVGSRDAFVDPEVLGTWQSDRVHRIDGADHFFAGYATELEHAISDALTGQR